MILQDGFAFNLHFFRFKRKLDPLSPFIRKAAGVRYEGMGEWASPLRRAEPTGSGGYVENLRRLIRTKHQKAIWKRVS